MNKEKDMKEFSSKRALLLSVISMVICVSMLIGSTFAWFTDSATANVNTIKSGNLDVELVDANGEKITEALKWVKSAEAPAGEKILWEPGCTYNLESFKIANKGDLALKYKVVISGLTGDATLLNAIDFTVKKGDAEVSLDNFTGKLLPAGKTATADDEEVGETALITITGTMKATAGNEYKGLSLENISITVYASQLNSESDSTGKDYDKDATYYPVLDAAGLKDALKTGGNVEVESDLDTGKETLKVTKDTTINMNGKEIKNTENIWIDDSGSDGNWSLISARNGANLTISGNGTFKAKANDAMAVDVQSGATLTIKNGTFIGNVDAVYVENGTAIIEGGFFDIQQKSNGTGEAQYRFMLNCYDANYKNGTAKIIVKGGTFVNFNPSNNAAEGAGTNFVAEGYSVISETKANGDVWYTVVEGTVVSNSEDLKTAIASAEAGDTIVLASGKYTVTTTEPMSISGVTFKAAPGATVDGVYLISNSSETRLTMDNITFDGITFTDKVVLGQDGFSWGLSQCSNIKFVNCNFDLSGSTETYPDAISLKGASVSGTISEKEDVAYVKGIAIEDCSFTNIRHALFCGKGRDVSIKNCKVENASSYAFRIDDVAGRLTVEGNTVTNAEGVLKINTVGNNYSTTDITTNVVVKGNNAYNMTCGNGNVFVTTFDNAKSSGKSTYTITGNSCTYTESFETPLCGFRIKSNYGPSKAEFIENN